MKKDAADTNTNSKDTIRLPAFILILFFMLWLPLSGLGCAGGDTAREYGSVATYVLFGRNIPSGGEVSEQQFNAFLDSDITPAFPSGLTVYDAYGQWRNQDGTRVQQKTKILLIVGPGSKSDSEAIHRIVKSYRDKFGGAGVLVMTTPATAEFFAN